MISASGCQHRLAQADLLVVDAAERHDRRTHAFRAEAGKRLRVASLEKRGDRQHFGAGHDALAATAVNSNLEHVLRTPAVTGDFAANQPASFGTF